MRFLYVCFALVNLCLMVAIECEALRCFACSYTSAEDKYCLEDPISLQNGITVCTKKYCTILRQELQTPKGKVQSFLRDCQEVPPVLNGIVEDDTFKSYYRSCTTDLCNSGDGTDSDGVGLNPDNPGQNLIIDGLDPNGSGGSSMKQGVVSGTCLLLSAAVLVFQ